MYLLETSKLQLGDIILTAERSIVSKGVRKFTKSDYSHAMLYVADSSYIHSDKKGVHSGNVQRFPLTKPTHASVLRLKGPIDASVISKAIDYARNNIGKQYSVRDALDVKLNSRARSLFDRNRQFCSRLVAEAYAEGGVRLVSDPAFCAPEELNQSPLLQVVSDCVRPASDGEVKFANSADPIKKQTHITNRILRRARSLYGIDIQTFEQLTLVILKDPTHDKEISQLVRSSGYLDMWKDESIKNLWRYDAASFLKLPIPLNEKRALATRELPMANNLLQLYSNEYGKYLTLWPKHQLEFIVIHIELYMNLTTQTNRWKEAAETVLKLTESIA